MILECDIQTCTVSNNLALGSLTGLNMGRKQFLQPESFVFSLPMSVSVSTLGARHKLLGITRKRDEHELYVSVV